MFALQFAPRAGNVTSGVELAPDFARQAGIQLGQSKCIARLAAGALELALAVEQQAGHAVAHQLAEQGSLQAQHHADDRIVGGARSGAARQSLATLGKVGSQLALQGRRQAERVAGQDAPRQHVERAPLRRGGHRLQRVAPAARMVTQRAHAADLARQDAGRAAGVADRIVDRASQHRVVEIRTQRAILLTRDQLAHDGQALLGEGNRVVAQVHLQRLGVDAERVVLVGCEGEQRLAAAPGDALKFGLLVGRRDRFVEVLDGPVVVLAERRLERRTASLARARKVDRQVLHHRTRQRVAGCVLAIGDLALVEGARGAEVVAQAQRVADLVHRHVEQVVEHELLRLGTRGIDLAACGQHVERIRQLLGAEFGVQALVGVLVRERSLPARRTRRRARGVEARTLQHRAPVVRRRIAQDARARGSDVA